MSYFVSMHQNVQLRTRVHKFLRTGVKRLWMFRRELMEEKQDSETNVLDVNVCEIHLLPANQLKTFDIQVSQLTQIVVTRQFAPPKSWSIQKVLLGQLFKSCFKSIFPLCSSTWRACYVFSWKIIKGILLKVLQVRKYEVWKLERYGPF